MKYGICPLSVVPLRAERSDSSEMVSQVLYGDFFKVLDRQKKWSRIRLAIDGYEGWLDNKQYSEITEEDYRILQKVSGVFSADIVSIISDEKNNLLTIPLGSDLRGLKVLGHSHEGAKFTKKLPKDKLIDLALGYLNVPYLWGGKTPFGIDCSGFTQMVYRLCGQDILRDASQQATLGEALSFIEESEPGDLAFFDNEEGHITHVGIIMKDHYIIHAHGKVRMDRLDHSGIYNVDLKKHTHKLRVIKKII